MTAMTEMAAMTTRPAMMTIVREQQNDGERKQQRVSKRERGHTANPISFGNVVFVLVLLQTKNVNCVEIACELYRARVYLPRSLWQWMMIRIFFDKMLNGVLRTLDLTELLFCERESESKI